MLDQCGDIAADAELTVEERSLCRHGAVADPFRGFSVGNDPDVGVVGSSSLEFGCAGSDSHGPGLAIHDLLFDAQLEIGRGLGCGGSGRHLVKPLVGEKGRHMVRLRRRALASAAWDLNADPRQS